MRENGSKTTRAISRRGFVKLAGGSVITVGSLGFAGCTGGRSSASVAKRADRYDASLTCTDTSQLLDAEIHTRTANEYTDRSPEELEYCFNCRNFLPPDQEGTCGGCDTVDGPINPLGWCKVWQKER